MNILNVNKEKNYCFQLSEYLQIACNGMHSVKLNITEDDLLIGNITINNGSLLNAIDNKGEGIDAFKRLILKKNTKVEMKQLAQDEKKKTIGVKCEELIFKIFTTKDRENSILDLSKNEKDGLMLSRAREDERFHMKGRCRRD